MLGQIAATVAAAALVISSEITTIFIEEPSRAPAKRTGWAPAVCCPTSRGSG
jgi:peptidoglycan/LPS O-acetylase OafA/YrhL